MPGKLIAILMLLGGLWPACASAEPRIAIIIDDIGYNRALGERAIALPGAITYAFIADAPHAAAQARLASQAGKQIMLHVPMQPYTHSKPALHPARLRPSDTAQQIAARLSAGFAAIPQAVGVNNHQGSLLTEQSSAMDAVMQALAPRGVFFVDSMTSGRSVAWQRARAAGLATARRDVFLDSQRSESAIRRQLGRLLTRASQTGSALAIGHPYPETLAVLEREIPRMQRAGVRIVPASDLTRRGGAELAHAALP